MHITFFRSFLAITAIVIGATVLPGCKSDPSTPPSPPPTPPADTTSLYLSSTSTDTVFTSPGSTFSISFLVKKGANPTDSAFIDFYDPILKRQTRLGPTGASGATIFFDTLPQQDLPFGVYPYSFVATRDNQKDSIKRYVSVGVDPVPLVLTMPLPVRDTTFLKHRASITFNFHVTHTGTPIDSAFVDFLDPLQSLEAIPVRIGPTAGHTGDLTWTDVVGPDVPSGPSTLMFIASHRNMLTDTMYRVIVITDRDSVPMGVRAHSLSSTSIGVSWTRIAKDKQTDTVIAMNGSDVAATALAAPTKSNVTLSGLSQGIVYAISVHATNAFSESFPWATAVRYGPVRLYESADPDPAHPSGLVLGTQATEKTPTNSDIVLSKDATFTLGSAPGKTTQFSYNYIISGGLDYVSFGSVLTSKFADSSFTAYQIPDGTDRTTTVFPIRTITALDTNYALLELKTQANGAFYDTTAAGFRFIDLNVSYQPTANAPYAGRPRRK